jgi:hypothetical protein
MADETSKLELDEELSDLYLAALNRMFCKEELPFSARTVNFLESGEGLEVELESEQEDDLCTKTQIFVYDSNLNLALGEDLGADLRINRSGLIVRLSASLDVSPVHHSIHYFLDNMRYKTETLEDRATYFEKAGFASDWELSGDMIRVYLARDYTGNEELVQALKYYAQSPCFQQEKKK